MQRAIVRIGWILVAPRWLMDSGGSKDTRSDAWCYELVWHGVRGDGKRVEARQHARHPLRARRLPAVQLDPGGQMPAVRSGDRYRKPEAKCASTFCRSGDSTTATANLHCDASIQQQLRPFVKPIAQPASVLIHSPQKGRDHLCSVRSLCTDISSIRTLVARAQCSPGWTGAGPHCGPGSIF